MEKKVAMETAIDLAKRAWPLQAATAQRLTSSAELPTPDVDVFVTYAGKEPCAWTAQFETWKPAPSASVTETPVMDVLQLYLPKTYPYEELLKDPLPAGVDQTRLESYLNEAEFQEVFGMDLAAFMKLPQWKAEQLKQTAKLF